MQEIRLPKNIPIFPLTGVLLLPGGLLPLHIFEQRYLDMFRDALAGDGIIGMIQPELEQAHLQNPAVFSTGCAGKISHHEDTSDGRMLVTLRGLCRFETIKEHDNGLSYRTSEVNYLPSGNIILDETENSKRQRLLNAASLYLSLLEENARLEPILEAGMSELVTVLSMHCPFSSREKQSLLEAPDLNIRVDRLIELLEQSALDGWQSDDQTVN
ncbi:MAG: LON peptidase substrate-binding domain-containing protein [Arenicellales bacterium]